MPASLLSLVKLFVSYLISSWSLQLVLVSILAGLSANHHLLCAMYTIKLIVDYFGTSCNSCTHTPPRVRQSKLFGRQLLEVKILVMQTLLLINMSTGVSLVATSCEVLLPTALKKVLSVSYNFFTIPSPLLEQGEHQHNMHQHAPITKLRYHRGVQSSCVDRSLVM